MGGWWLSEHWQISPAFTLSWVAWVIISITLHELAHGVIAIKCGDDTPRATGHMTWNPLVHIPFPWAWIMFALFGFTWGLMPVNPSRFRGRYDHAKVAFAGPAANFLLAAACVLLDVLWLSVARGVGDPVHLNVHTFLFAGAMINAVGFLFNLIPVPPLDGSSILADFFPAFGSLIRGEHAGWITAAFGLLLFRYGGAVVWPVAILGVRLSIELGLGLSGGAWRAPY